MTDFTFNPSGGLEVYNCSACTLTKNYYYNFSVGDIAYVYEKARNGILEKVAIKRVIFNGKFNYPIFVYEDTTKECWFEEELAYEQDAVAYVLEYQQKKLDDTMQAIKECRI